MNTKSATHVRKLTMTAMLSAISAVLMFFQFNVPLMPSFIKLDFSELPALIAAFTMGPVSGVAVCFIKNLINLLTSSTGGVGELANFFIGCAFVLPAGYLYRKTNTRKGAIAASLIGAATMAVFSIPINYYISYPVYTLFIPMDAIISMYQVINPNISNLLEALIVFNMPFTFIKGLCNVGITFLIYKRISPLIKGNRTLVHQKEKLHPANHESNC